MTRTLTPEHRAAISAGMRKSHARRKTATRTLHLGRLTITWRAR